MFSVIIPNYNKGRYVEHTLKSIISQSFLDWECIIIDDFSSDNSIEIINEIIKNDLRFKLIINNQNRGANYCRNLGLKFSSKKFVLFIDSDDLLTIDCFKNRLQLISFNNSLDFYVFAVGTFEIEIGDKNSYWDNFRGNLLNRFLSHDLPWTISSVIWEKKHLKSIGGFNESYKRLQDVELHTRALLNHNLNYKLFPESIIDFFYRTDSNKIENYSTFCNNEIDSKIKFTKEFINLIESKKKKYLIGTLFSCLNSPFNFYQKGQLNKNELNLILKKIFQHFQDYNMNKMTMVILNFYIYIRMKKIYFKGLNKITLKLARIYWEL